MRNKNFLIVTGSMIIALLLIIAGLPMHEAVGVSVATGGGLAFLDQESLIRDLKEQRSEKLQEMQVLVDKSETEKRDFSDDEQTDYDKLKGEAEALERRYTRLEETLVAKREAAKAKGQQVENRNEDEDAEKREAAFRSFLAGGKASMTSEERALITPSKAYLESRNLNGNSKAAGGVLVPTSFAKEMVVAMLDLGGIRPIANVFATETGAPISIPTMNDAGEKGERLGTASDRKATTDSKELFDSVDIGATTYSSKVIKVDNELLQDNSYKLTSVLAKICAARIANITNEDYTIGTGEKMPKGILVAAPKGATATAANALSFDDLIELEHSVNSVYRKNAHFMFNDNTLKVLKKMKDGDGRPLWVDNTRVKEPNTINGYPYQINDEMPDIGANNKSITFGNHKAYAIRDVDGAVLIRMGEKYAEENRTGFVLFSRHDGVLKDGGTHPVKYLQHPES